MNFNFLIPIFKHFPIARNSFGRSKSFISSLKQENDIPGILSHRDDVEDTGKKEKTIFVHFRIISFLFPGTGNRSQVSQFKFLRMLGYSSITD